MTTTLRRKELVRGRILTYLALIYPQSATLPLLQGELDIFGYAVPVDELNFHVAYLGEKGLVGVEPRSLGARGPANLGPISLVKITAKGIDYVDGRLPAEEGVYLEPQS